MTESTGARDAGRRARPSANLVPLGVDTTGWDYVVALAGNPNTGKSTVFNALTGLRQHTGNWPGKTVTRAEGGFSYEGERYKLVDLPGTYSLSAMSLDEETARDFILFGRPDVTVVVVDGTRLERNLNLVLQVLEITAKVVICLNLMDEAARHGFKVDAARLEQELGVPVVPTSARSGQGIDRLNRAIADVANGRVTCQPYRISKRSAELPEAVNEVAAAVRERFPGLANSQWVALRLLDGDHQIVQAVATGELGKLQETGDARTSETAEEAPKHDGVLDLATRLRWELGHDFQDILVKTIYKEAARIGSRAVDRTEGRPGFYLDRNIDRLVTSRWLGIPIMLLLLTVVFWITVSGANIPSRLLASFLLDTLHPALKSGAHAILLPDWLIGVLIDGMYMTTAWVVSVMLPPMAIFFPLFTLLEDFGYLPRVAFNSDKLFKCAGAHGKQALTMCMGFGCNAAGVIATRVIDSPRERLIAIITNNFALCNGRWPTQILVATIFIGSLVPAPLAGLVAALAVVSVAILGILLTFVTSWALSRTLLRGEISTFSLELPPYRPPRLFETLYTSLIDRTLFVLWRAVLFAAPAGAVIWLLANLNIGDASVAEHLIAALDPFGLWIGLNGVILLAYVVAIPANEIVMPTILMLIVLTGNLAGVGEGAGVIFELESESATAAALGAGQWSLLTAVNVMLFSLIHNPCSTTLYTIWKETRSVRWTLLSALLPLVMGIVVCLLVAQISRLFVGA